LVFTCSWSDFFIEEADDWRDEAWEIIRNTPHLTYQILTKRPERILECLPEDWGDGYDNVWLGVTVENNATRQRINSLSGVPARIRFISFEPLLEWLELADYMPVLAQYYHWAILGGESGNDNGQYRYRPCQLEWLEYLADVCKMAQMAVFVKQLGTHLHHELGLRDRHARDVDEFPESLKVREFPCKIDANHKKFYHN
jgi:protein gp37